jgi:hypothetical protein
MAKFRLAILLLLVGATITLLSACQDLEPVPAPTPTQAATATSVAPEPNFAFVFEWRWCGTYTLDTFDDTLTVVTVMSPTVPITISFALSQQDLSAIYGKMVDIDLFDYPTDFAIQLPPDVLRVYGISASYRFDIRNGEQWKVVRWEDQFDEPRDVPWKAEDSEPSRTQATKLRELIDLIVQFVKARPEFDKLPNPGGCA